MVEGCGNTIVVADGSGSMTTTVGGTNTTALEVANALAIYFAERSSGEFKDKYITFSSRPQFVDMSPGKSLRDKLSIALGHNEVTNTNIEAVFDLILSTAVRNNMSQEDSLVERSVEKELMAAAKELGVKVLAFGTVGHGLLRDDIMTAPANQGRLRGMLAPEHWKQNLAMLLKVKEIADEKGVTLSQLALAWSLAKYDHPQKVFPHNLRHLFARTFYGIEKDIAKLADILGHSSINTTRIYIISTGTEHRQRMENMRLII